MTRWTGEYQVLWVCGLSYFLKGKSKTLRFATISLPDFLFLSPGRGADVIPLGQILYPITKMQCRIVPGHTMAWLQIYISVCDVFSVKELLYKMQKQPWEQRPEPKVPTFPGQTMESGSFFLAFLLASSFFSWLSNGTRGKGQRMLTAVSITWGLGISNRK